MNSLHNRDHGIDGNGKGRGRTVAHRWRRNPVGIVRRGRGMVPERERCFLVRVVHRELRWRTMLAPVAFLI